MTLPQIEKQWEFDVNQSYPALDTSVNTHRRVLRGIKDSLVGVLGGRPAMASPWVVKRSSDGATVDNSDLWTGSTDEIADAKLVFGSSNHSWIVLEQPGISDNFQICIDLSNTEPTMLTIVWAPDGFPMSGDDSGDASSRPTAATEVVLLDDADWLGGQTTNANGFRIHAMQSVDGECTRIVGYCNSHPVLFWLFDRPARARTVSEWSTPAVALAMGSYDGNLTYADLHTVSTPNLRGYGTSAPMRFWMSTESFGSSLAAIGAKFTEANAFDGTWPLTPIGLACMDSGYVGRHGEITDLWFGSSTAHHADTYPGDGSRQLVQFGHLVFPWDGTPEADGSDPAIS